ncbi:MAG: hypothetical protein Q8Q35_02635 [Nanoarchaeota archaeon]|nr:hypothetical protein [Nanoarchaeota archaeon]
MNKHNQNGNKEDIMNALARIKNIFNVKIVEIKINRPNNHYYICSKEFTKYVNDNTQYGLPWEPLNTLELNILLEKWQIIS